MGTNYAAFADLARVCTPNFIDDTNTIKLFIVHQSPAISVSMQVNQSKPGFNGGTELGGLQITLRSVAISVEL